jgi:hypothetical protein
MTCNYKVALSVQIIIRALPWSTPVIGHPAKLLSVTSKIIKFFFRNKEILLKLTGAILVRKLWDPYTPNS